MTLVHHELCFGCGRNNLFGLLLEAERSDDGSVSGRCFIKQDHQGAVRGRAHEGILAAALAEAMSLACGPGASAHAVTVGYLELPAVGEFVRVEAEVVERAGEELTVAGSALSDAGAVIARARGAYIRSA